MDCANGFQENIFMEEIFIFFFWNYTGKSKTFDTFIIDLGDTYISWFLKNP